MHNVAFMFLSLGVVGLCGVLIAAAAEINKRK